MVSGTLAVDGNFSYLRRGLGLTDFPPDRLREEMLASPFDYKRRALVLVPHDMPAPDFRDQQAHGRFLDALAETVTEAARVFGGATLVLFNSYADLNAVAGKLDGLKSDGFAVLSQERGASRFQLAGEFKATRKSVLLGVRSFWEGFDIRGEALQCVVISRLPFPNLHDPLTAGKVRYIDEHDGDSFNLYMLPSAIMKFKQGFGRLIRSTEDFGCVLLLDQRALTKRYGASFLRELPGPAIKKLPRRRVAEVLAEFISTVRGGAQ
jgi:ATP-dependent DNA helicase DinG